MPLFTFYLFHRQTRKPVDTWNRWPSDWAELRGKLEEVANKVYCEFKQSNSVVSLERHLSGRYHMASRNYGPTRVRYRRNFEAYFRLAYSPTSNLMQVEQASFGSSLSFLLNDFLLLEKGRQYRPPPVIPKEHKGLLDRSDMFRFQGESSELQYPDYSQPEHLAYCPVEDRLHIQQHYQEHAIRSYLSVNEKIREEIQVES